MIDDWVYDTILQGYTRVKVLTARGIKGDIHDNIWDEDTFAPIPLTPEILEKNGWISKRDGSGDFIYMRENTQGYGSNDMTVTKNIVGNFQMIHGSFNGISVYYVHELQHCLKLVGIDKEIEL